MDTTITTTDRLSDALLSLAVSGWRFSRAHVALVQSLALADQPRHMASVRFYQRHLEDTLRGLGYEVVDLTGHGIDPGLPVVVLNLGDFTARDLLVVDQVIEPVIMCDGSVVKTGTVVARKIG